MVKDKTCVDKEGKIKLKASVSKNEHFRELVCCGTDNQEFGYVLSDSWYANAENIRCVVEQAERDFIMAMKENRRVALNAGHAA